MEEPRKKLYDLLVNDGLYTKSYDDFNVQFSNVDSREKLYNLVIDKGYYTKTSEDFTNQFFSDTQKKNPVGTSSQESSEGSQTGLPPVNAPIAEGSSEYGEFVRTGDVGVLPQTDKPVEKETNPLKSIYKSVLGWAKYDLPAQMAAVSTFFSPTEAGLENLKARHPDWYQEKYGTDENWKSEAMKDVRDEKTSILKWALDRQEKGAEYKKDLIQSVDDIKDPLDLLNFASVAVGQAVPQILATAATAGVSGLGQATGSIYLDEVKKLSDDYNIPIEEVIDRGLDDQATAAAFGFASAALEKIGADAVLGRLTKGALDKAVRGRTKALIKVLGVGGSAAIEGTTEAAQEVIEELGSSIGSGTDFNLDWKQVRDAAAMGAIGGGAITSATTIGDYITTKNQLKDEKQVQGQQAETEVQTLEQPEAEVPVKELTVQEIIDLQQKVEANTTAEVGASVEYQGKQQQIVDEKRTEEDEIQSITLRDDQGNETEVQYDDYLRQQNEGLKDIPEEQLRLATIIGQQGPPAEPVQIETRRFDENDIDEINNLGIDNLKPIVNAFKAVEDVKGVTIHKDDASFAEAVGSIAAGAYVGGEVHINAQRVNSTTGLHEAITPIAAKVATSSPELLDNFYEQIKASKDYDSLKEFEALYEGEAVQKEEVLTEYLARVASGEIKPEYSTLEKVKAFIQAILDKIGLNVIDLRLEDETDIRFFAGKMAEALRSGKPLDAEGVTNVARNQKDVFHGSPHDFDRFTTKKIGTGEGAQAFGWGLYFTDRKDIAEWYADKLSEPKPRASAIRTIKIGGSNLFNHIKKQHKNAFGRVPTDAEVISLVKRVLIDQPNASINLYPFLSDDTVLSILNNKDQIVAKDRNLYKTKLFKGKQEGEYELLDWNEPISDEQKSKVASQFEKEFGDIYGGFDLTPNVRVLYFSKDSGDLFSSSPLRGRSINQVIENDGIDTNKVIAVPIGSHDHRMDLNYYKDIDEINEINNIGRTIYQSLTTFFGDQVGMDYNEAQKQASMLMLRAGIDGIRYPAASGGGGDGSKKGYNYVIFDEADVEVEEKVRFQNPVNPALVQAKDVLRQGVESGFITQANRQQMMQDVANHFNLPMADVDAVMRHIEQGPKSIKLPKYISSNKVYKTLADAHGRYLSGRKGMPRKVQQLMEILQGSIASQVEASMNIAKKVNKMAGKKWIKDVDDLLRGTVTPQNSPLPPNLKGLVVKMRASVDKLTQTILDEGYVEEMVLGTRTTAGIQASIANLQQLQQGLQGVNTPQARQRMGLYDKKIAEMEAKLRSVDNMRQVLQDNMGKYLTRAYEVYNNKDYKPEKAVFDRAVDWAMVEMSMTRDQADRWVREQLLKYKQLNEDKSAGESQARTGRKDYSSFMEREEIPVELRELMGEYTDPIQAFGITIHRLAGFVENARFLNNMKEIGMGSFLFKKGDLNAPAPSKLRKISAKGNKSLLPLDGLYTYKEIYDELKGRDDIVRGHPIIAWANAIVNWNKTVGSYQTHARNVIGNIPFMIGNGYFLSVDPKTWGEPTKAVLAAFQAVGVDATGRFGSKEVDGAVDQLLARLKSNGVIGQNISTNLIKDLLNQEDIPAELYKRRYNKTKNIFSRGWNATKKGVDILNTLYGAEDDFFKVAAYLIESNQRADAHYGKKYNQLTEEQKREIDQETMEIVKNVLPNYGRLGRAIKLLSSFPLVGNFVPFMTEAMRVSANTWRLAFEELRSDNNGIKRIGARRLINQMAYTAGKAAVIKGLSAASGIAIQSLTGWWDDEEPREKERAVREFLPPWVKDNDIAILSNEDGVITVQDISATDPHGNFARIKNAIRMTDDPMEIPAIIGKELITPFFDETILFNWLRTMKEGRTNYGQDIVRNTAPINESLEAYIDYTARVVGPSSYNSAMKIYEGKSNLTGQIFGNQYKINLGTAFYFKMKEFTNVTGGGADKEGIRRELNKTWNSDMPVENKEERTEQLNREYKGSLDTLKDQYEKAILLGADPDELYDILKNGGTNKIERGYIIYGDSFTPLGEFDVNIRK